MAQPANIPILTYHSIDENKSVISTAPGVFRRQMKRLNETGLTTITLEALSRSLIEKKEIPSNAVVLTFDDGFQNFYTAAFPVLEQYGLKATVFLVTDYCGKNNDWEGNTADASLNKLMSWAEIKELSACGVEFGAHTRTHPDLTRISHERVKREIAESKSAIEDKLGKPITAFAYPYGKSTNAVRQITRQSFSAACSTNLGKVSTASDLLSLERIDSYYLASQFVFDSFSSRKIDHYLRLRQSLRNIKALVPKLIKRRNPEKF